jgi:hypothetical protein
MCNLSGQKVNPSLNRERESVDGTCHLTKGSMPSNSGASRLIFKEESV